MSDPMKFYTVEHDLPCRNPNCKSKGRPHPNCGCYGGGGPGDYLAKGGVVCDGPHKSDCEYFLDGGPVAIPHVSEAQPTNPSVTLGHAAVSHGLMGLLKNVGKPKMADPDAHHKTMDKLKEHLSMNDHDKANSILHGTPVAGSVGKEPLKHIVGHLAPAILSNDSHPESLRGAVDYMHSAIKGHSTLDSHVGKMLGHDKLDIGEDDGHSKALKEYLKEAQENPASMLEVAGSLGHYMPDHAAALGAMTSTAVQYLNSIKPASPQSGPLDEPMAPNKGEMATWDRQLMIAQHPTSLIQSVKQGTLLPQDITTVKTIYPALYSSMASKASESLIEAKAKDKEIPYKQRLSLSMLLGEPLDGTMTPMAMQAILHSAGPQQAQNQQKGSAPKKEKATAEDIKQMNRVDQLDQTTLQARQINRNKH